MHVDKQWLTHTMHADVILVYAFTHTHTHKYSQANNNSIVGFPGAEATEENLLLADCDILIPAAGEQQITADVARQMKAKVSKCT